MALHKLLETTPKWFSGATTCTNAEDSESENADQQVLGRKQDAHPPCSNPRGLCPASQEENTGVWGGDLPGQSRHHLQTT